ncbi:MAG TPA: multicopper oxidase family protein [Candidatus Dormibacteraeota bacterium]|nr:multicopper oxidase family protein [Candidatus Dormibacteraeota bacterium]
MNRRAFLAGGARLAAGAMSARAFAPISARAAQRETVDVTLTAAPYVFSPFPGVAYHGLAYNGAMPGPVIRVRSGQRLRARLVNHTGAVSTVHWHGMILPNDMDGVPDVTQAPVPNGGEFVYEYVPGPTGTRWYHSHVRLQQLRGLFGMIIIEDPRDERADLDVALVFHDVPKTSTVMAAMMGTSTAPMVDPPGSPELLSMAPDDKMGDEVAYAAHCVNGACYPKTKPIVVNVGQKVRLRILNANPTQTRYVRLAGHTLRVTHSDGNPLPQPVEVEALRIGVAERYDAWFEVTKPGAWLLQGLSSDPMVFEQAVVIHTPGMEGATPLGSPQTLVGVKYLTYELAGAALAKGTLPGAERIDVSQAYVLGGGAYGSDRWTMNGKIWPHTDKIAVRRGDNVEVRFKNTTDMHHPMHLHGHVFEIVEINGRALRRPLPKDTSLVDPNGGTMTWRFRATSPAGRWVLHCHNDIHMMDGMMTEVDYR